MKSQSTGSVCKVRQLLIFFGFPVIFLNLTHPTNPNHPRLHEARGMSICRYHFLPL
ncbi:hypothetical protein [Limnospira fusiformis]|uniref:hypothetical protein n=1 Tax=Limnospira fusiformis TaxID=54297 RepID=UPI001314D03F